MGALLGVVAAALALSSFAAARPGIENAGPVERKVSVRGLSIALFSRGYLADLDRDGLTDRAERLRTRTDPRRVDTDGDGVGDGIEVLFGSDPRDPASRPGGGRPSDPPKPPAPIPAPTPEPPAPAPQPPAPSPPVPEPSAPPPDPEPEPPAAEPGPEPLPEPEPEPAPTASAVWTAPAGATAGVPVTLDGSGSTGVAPIVCTWTFENASGSTVFQTRRGCELPFTFESTGTKHVRLQVLDASGDSDASRQSFAVSAAPRPPEPPAPEPEPGPPAPEPEPEPEAPEPQPEPPAPGNGGCTAGSTRAASAAAVRSAVAADDDVCVTAAVGDVNLENLGSSAVVISTDGGSMGYVNLKDTTDVTIRDARFRSVLLYLSHRTALLGNTIGGTPTNRVLDQLIFMPARNDDVRIERNDIGWTRADNSGNTGYGCRCYGELNRLRFVANRVHDIAADGFQGVNGTDVLIDRNEIGPVGANPGSNEHSDNIQIVGNGPNLRITNNWIHHQGYFDGAAVGNAGSMYIHGGSDNPLLIENNFFQIARGRSEICGLGTGGRERSNITIRRNTWLEGGGSYSNFPGFEWDCTGGSGNTVARNLAIDPDGGFALNGSSAAAAFSANLWGQPSAYSLDASGNCIAAACNPDGAEPIGYRKPSGVRW